MPLLTLFTEFGAISGKPSEYAIIVVNMFDMHVYSTVSVTLN